MTNKLSIILTLFLTHLLSCSSTPTDNEGNFINNNTLNIRELSGTINLHPLYVVDEFSGVINSYLFQTLTSIDFSTLELTPLLLSSLPEIDTSLKDTVIYHFKIRNEAKWDNGKKITSNDVVFSIKVNLLPDPGNTNHTEFLKSIVDLKIDFTNNKNFSIYSTMDFHASKYLIGDITILPKYLYDSNNVLSNYSIKFINENFESLKDDTTILKYLTEINDTKFKINPSYILGSGPYKVKEVVNGQYLTLEKKENWWADSLKYNNTELQANAEIIKYHIIPDETTALAALKNRSIDVMRGISPKEFSEMLKVESLTNRLNFVTAPILAHYCLGLNLTHPILKSNVNRRALAHLLDVKKIIDIVAYGYGEQIIGPNSKTDKDNYNFDIQPYRFDLEKAKSILYSEGWEDLDHDGIIEKMIDGINVPFEITYSYNSGNETRKKIGLIFQEDAKKVGIKINLNALEWSNYIDQLKNKNFEMAFIGKISAPIPRNHKNIFHSESITEGANYVGYSNPEVDKLIDLINFSKTKEERAIYNMKFQEIIHKDLPYLYLFAPLERMVINKKFTNYNLSAMRPGFWAPGFKLAE